MRIQGIIGFRWVLKFFFQYKQASRYLLNYCFQLTQQLRDVYFLDKSSPLIKIIFSLPSFIWIFKGFLNWINFRFNNEVSKRMKKLAIWCLIPPHHQIIKIPPPFLRGRIILTNINTGTTLQNASNARLSVNNNNEQAQSLIYVKVYLILSVFIHCWILMVFKFYFRCSLPTELLSRSLEVKEPAPGSLILHRLTI